MIFYENTSEKSLIELYEDIKDREAVEQFEEKENRGDTAFKSFEDIIS